jgi:DNA repair protein RecO (recombination protein O)
MKRVALEPAFLLAVRAYRETSSLIEAFTPAHGRVGLVARGSRSPRSKLRGLLQPFQPLLLSWSEGGELATLAGAESAGPPLGLTGETVLSGWYLNELVLRLLARRDPHGALYEAYGRALGSLADGAAAAATLRRFELELLAELGYAVHLPEDIAPEGWYGYDPEAGLRAAEPGPGAYRGASLRALAAGTLDTEESLSDARRLLRAALAPHLGTRPLRTPQVARALQAGIRGHK